MQQGSLIRSARKRGPDVCGREPELRGELAVRRFRIGILEIVKLEQLEVDHFATRLATGPEPL